VEDENMLLDGRDILRLSIHHPHPLVEMVKVKLSLCSSATPWRRILCLIKHHAMKTYGGAEV
jgi:hypothetical protein